MEENYNRALLKIRELNRIITEKEWNKMAEKENLLSTESIKFIGKKSLRELCEENLTMSV